jgi:hypothetical protein
MNLQKQWSSGESLQVHQILLSFAQWVAQFCSLLLTIFSQLLTTEQKLSNDLPDG